MQLFIHSEFSASDQSIVMGFDESKHMIKVLRYKVGDKVSVTNTKGLIAKGTIVRANPKACVVQIDSSEKLTPPKYSIHIAIAPTKQMERLEWFVEKSTELGATRITPIICDHSERQKVRIDRLEKRRDSALKQSLNAYNVQIDPICSFESFVNKQHLDADLYLAHCLTTRNKNLIQAKSLSNNSIILIGPEGGFSNKEIAIAEENGYQSISLGNRRLRTETAGITAVQYLIIRQLLNEL